MCGMITTRMIGHKCCEEDDTFQDPILKEYFGTLLDSWFTLFQIMTLEGWPDLSR